jgi:hypothetical protein
MNGYEDVSLNGVAAFHLLPDHQCDHHKRHVFSQ